MNKGTAFTAEERKALGLTGLLPPDISTLATQVKRAYIQYERLPDALSKNIYLTALHDRNEVLFYRLFSEHLREMIPIVNDLTVGMAMEQYHHECRRPRGVYLSIDHAEAIEEAFANLGAGPGDIDLILATDAEQILGIGDWGVGGIEVSIGKLAIYTAAGGIDPTRVIPVMLDVGTNREDLLDDPTYIGNRHARIRGERYDAFIDAYVDAVTKLFPNALLQWEDFAPGNGRRILEKYRDRICTFNDDMQGTGAITLAAAISAVRVCGTPLRNQRVVIFGAGTAGIGIADQIRDAMVREGLSERGCGPALLVRRPAGSAHDRYGRPTARLPGDVRPAGRRKQGRQARREWNGSKPGRGGAPGETDHADRRVHRGRQFHRSDREGDGGTHGAADHLCALQSAAAVRGEPGRSDCLDRRAGADRHRQPVRAGHLSGGDLRQSRQVNNAMLYPGLGLGAIVSRASRISDGMFAAAANAVSSLVTVRQPGASLLPHIDDLRSVSATVAVAVAEAADAEGLAGVKLADIVQQVQDAMWQPEYRRIQAS